MILNPSCSESVFKLTGSFKAIKREVLNMLDIAEQDYKDGCDMKVEKERKEYADYKKRVDEKRKEVSKIKALDDFRLVVFPFTCNYETFFKPDKNDLIVATCNNTDWEGMDMEYLDSDKVGQGYYDIAGYENYNILCKGDGWIYVSMIDDGKGGSQNPIIFKMEHQRHIDTEDNKSIKIIKKGKLYFYVGQIIVQLDMIDKKNLSDDDRKIMNECDKKLVVERLE